MAPSVPLDYTEQRDLKTMGKAKKFSKGHSAGFVPDYRHAVETTADSDVFGSSGRGVEAGMGVSADLFKRKSISLNADTYERYGVPLQVFSLSKMSRPQRKDLELRFKNELQQVRRIQKEIDSYNSNAVVSSYIRTCSDEPKRQPVESYPRSMDLSQGKKRGPPGRNGSRTKGGSAGRVDLVKQVTPTTSNFAVLMKKCETLLNNLMSHQYGWVFNTPVDVVKLKIPDYFNVIKHPMDLGTVKNKLLSGGYSSPQEFAADVRLTFSNAMTYNPSDNDVHIMANTLRKYFESRWKPIEKKIPVVIDTPVLSTSSVHIETETPRQMSPPKKKRFKSVDNKIKQDPPVKHFMTASDRQKLSDELYALVADETSELPDSVVDLLKKQSNGSNGAEEEEIEIEVDINDLDNDTVFTLRKLLDDHYLEKQNKQCGDEAQEMKLLNNSGVSNSSTHPPEGNDPLDEDVDIGGNDPPLSSCPPVEIEKDMPPRNSKCSSSSSSSSDSGSSSSDSDSGSSGSDSDGGRAPAASPKEKMGSGENVGQTRNDIDNATLGEDLAGVNQIEQNVQSTALGVDIEVCQEGESVSTGRQVSPDKLYRAALLRSRFADTILKAQEKNLDKGEKTDPEKLRLEREELERRRKEEKARLQAEARAAEEARRKAEEDAIAEAKRQRELKREAERQALQKMEKTVEINENCQFMEDLEMLRAAPGEHVESYADVASPVVSETGGLGSFNFQGNSNPLEQLGLYMKVDDEEEDEAPPRSGGGGDAADGGGDGEEEDVDIDVEEGEID